MIHRVIPMRSLVFTVLFSSGITLDAYSSDVDLTAVRRSYSAARAQIHSLYLEYTLKATPLFEKDLVYKYSENAYLLDEEHSFFSMGNKLYSRILDHSKPEIEGMVVIPERIMVYDGNRLAETRPRAGRNITTLHNILDGQGQYFSTAYLNAICLSVADPGDSQSDGNLNRNSIPELFNASAFSDKVTIEDCDGADCLVFDTPTHHKLWLDPELGFAVRKREVWYDGALAAVAECHDFEDVGIGLWLPREVDWFDIAKPTSPNKYQGQKMMRERLSVSKLAVNDAQYDSLCTIEIAPGTTVIDQTVSDRRLSHPKPGDLIPSVNYQQPANEKELAAVIAAAKEAEMLRTGNSLLRLTIIVASAVILSCVTFFFVRHRF